MERRREAFSSFITDTDRVKKGAMLWAEGRFPFPTSMKTITERVAGGGRGLGELFVGRDALTFSSLFFLFTQIDKSYGCIWQLFVPSITALIKSTNHIYDP